MAEQERYSLLHTGAQVDTTVDESHAHTNKAFLDTLSTKTVYTAIGDSTHIPVITTNSAGQVVTIATVAIDASSANQKVSALANGSTITFGADDVVNFKAGSNVTISANASSKYVEISSSYVNTTYTFATGDTFGTFKVTPAGGSAQTITINGLNQSTVDSGILTLGV